MFIPSGSGKFILQRWQHIRFERVPGGQQRSHAVCEIQLVDQTGALTVFRDNRTRWRGPELRNSLER
jgi:hypothetical protein